MYLPSVAETRRLISLTSGIRSHSPLSCHGESRSTCDPALRTRWVCYWQWKGDIASRHPNDENNTVLHVCCNSGHLSIAELFLTEYRQVESKLLQMYADLPVNLLNASGFTPLMLAASNGKKMIRKAYDFVFAWVTPVT